MTSAEIPGLSGNSDDASPVTAIRTGTRCTTFVKLPVALSGGSRANRAPVAGLTLSTVPRNSCPG